MLRAFDHEWKLRRLPKPSPMSRTYQVVTVLFDDRREQRGSIMAASIGWWRDAETTYYVVVQSHSILRKEPRRKWQV